MRALNRKLARETWRMRAQLASIAMVVAAGVMTVVTLRGTYVSLESALERFYREYRFAHVFADLERAPESLARRIERLPGVGSVQTRVVRVVTLDVPGLDEPAIGQILSIPDQPEPTLNQVHIVRGRYIEPGRPDEILISESFTIANGLAPGDAIGAVINGRWRRLEIVGIAISPDFIGEMAPGSILPDDRRFAVIRMGRGALAAAANLEGAFNEVSVTLASGASEADVIGALDDLLEPYGGRGAFGRDRHLSHDAVMGELVQVEVMGTTIPAIFLGVAAFLLNVVLGRLVGTQRDLIGVLKAFGYPDAVVGRHYLAFALAAALIGAAAGTAVGVWFGGGLIGLYGKYFRLPDLAYEVSWGLVALAAAVSIGAAVAGALGAVRRAARMPPAEAMRPETPMRFRAGPLERLGLARWLSASTRMIIRNVERRPWRSLAAALGVAFSVALLVTSMFFYDAVEHMMDVQFDRIQREDLAVYFVSAQGRSALRDLAHVDGVTRVEAFRTVPVWLSHGHRRRSVAIMGLEPGGELRRVIDADRGAVGVPAGGVMLGETLAEALHVSVGDTLVVRSLEGKRVERRAPVTGLVNELFGIAAYMDYASLHAMLDEPPMISGALLAVDADRRTEASRHLQRLPSVAGVHSPAALRASFEAMMDENLFVSVTFLVVLAAILGVGVIYNGARIALAERGRELASLRVLGFSAREVTALLLGEQAAITMLAIPLGWVLGIGIGVAVLAQFEQERYRIPMVITEQTYIYSALIAILSAVLAGIAVRRRIYRLDLIEVLKTRE